MRDPTAAEMRRFLKKRHGTEADDFDVESAIYWFANDWHGGQSSNLYSALSTSDYRPGASERGPTDHAAIMYADLEDWTGAERKGTLAKVDRPGRPAKNPALPKVGSAIVGYPENGRRIMGPKGYTGWSIERVVRDWRLHGFTSSKGEAVVLIFRSQVRTRPYYAGAYSMGDGVILRGEVTGYSLDDAKREAISQAEYWMQRDAEDEEDFDRELEEGDDDE